MREDLGQILRLRSGKVFKEIFVMLLLLTAVLLVVDILRNGLVSYCFNFSWLFLALFIVFLLSVKFLRTETLPQKSKLTYFLGAGLFLLLVFKTLSLGWFSLIISAVFIIFFITFWIALRAKQ